MKLSFLIPAHNEEKIIAKTLDNLGNIHYDNYEVLVGLDGCTDNTEEIVKMFSKKYNNIKYYILNLRQGKPAVIDELIKHSTGDIIIINDADWIFHTDKKGMRIVEEVFKDPKIGGIAESFPVEWDIGKLKQSNFTFKMVAWSHYFWFEYQKMFLSSKVSRNLRRINTPKMFLTNIFRKHLYRKNFSLGDDFERTLEIKNQGFDIMIFEDEKLPRMISIYNEIKFKDLIKQKVRTAIARKQLKNIKDFDIGIKNYYLSSVFYIFKKSWSKGINIGFMVSLWILINIYAEFTSKFKSIDTKKGWLMRAKR